MKVNVANDFSFYLRQIGANIRYERTKRGLTIVDLAHILDLAPGFIGSVERGNKCTSLQNLMTIAELFDLTLDQLVTWDIEEFETSKDSTVQSVKETPAKLIYTIFYMLKKMNSEQLQQVYENVKAIQTLGEFEKLGAYEEMESLRTYFNQKNKL